MLLRLHNTAEHRGAPTDAARGLARGAEGHRGAGAWDEGAELGEEVVRGLQGAFWFFDIYRGPMGVYVCGLDALHGLPRAFSYGGGGYFWSGS
jgi:hypothetical protein